MKDIRRQGGRILTFEEFADGTCEARLYYRQGDGRWQPPLPRDIQLTIGAGEPSRSIARSSSSGLRRPSWKLSDKEEHSYRNVELREHYVSYKVALTPQVRDDILGEIKRAHREAGEPVEVAGWLFARYLPRPHSDSIELVHVTRSGAGPGSRTQVTVGDPIDAMAFVRSEGLGHLRLVGDWHAHCARGSDLPSMQDARAWAGTADALGRESYVSLVVAPNANGYGWTMPKFSGWITERVGVPSKPICGRACVEG